MTIGLGLGLSKYPFESPDGYWRWVELCERGGIDSIWQTDRLVSKDPILECIAVTAALAGATETIHFGMSVASIAFRDPLLTAKQLATIDVLSKGRLLPAFGLGSSFSADFRASGTPTKRRGKRADEVLKLIHKLWHEEDICYNGEFFRYDHVTISPRPVNQSIPLWIGGSSEKAIERVARYGTGWLGGIETPEESARVILGIKEALKKTGRSIDKDHYGATFSFRFGNKGELESRLALKRLGKRVKDPSKYLVIGDTEDIVKRIDQYIDAGCSKFVMLPIASDEKETIQQTRLVIDEILPTYWSFNRR
ncbi:MAG: LLM class flavin-dependent oxidoreductase [Gammaproteobacteria bacterium TMED1]|nr:MAG: LLM class flavin-dependent oxidoreductase [Gammaproteobacteria bacterium TMED1]|tara:strand:- start:3121 stop:4047 length:927 start_codon:yes stop_codon:yes gene_type:complete